MKSYFSVGIHLYVMLLLASSGIAQTDELRQATGLPIPIGAPAIYGRVHLKGLAPNAPKPSVYVLLVGGTQVNRVRTNDTGYYYFLTQFFNGATLVFEVDGMEVGRVVLSAGIGSATRQDMTIDLPAFQRIAASRPGVISAKDAYRRSEESNLTFDKAMAAAKAKKTDDAVFFFRKLVDKDPKDFVAWAELGTVYFGDSKYSEAEAAYSSSLEQKPDFIVALMNFGKLHLAQNQPEKAIAIFTRAANAERSSADAFHYLGESYLQLKQGTKAVVALNESIRLAPMEKAELHLRLATLYNAAGVKDRAVNEYKLFLGKVPDHPAKEKLKKYIKENSK